MQPATQAAQLSAAQQAQVAAQRAQMATAPTVQGQPAAQLTPQQQAQQQALAAQRAQLLAQLTPQQQAQFAQLSPQQQQQWLAQQVQRIQAARASQTALQPVQAGSQTALQPVQAGSQTALQPVQAGSQAGLAPVNAGQAGLPRTQPDNQQTEKGLGRPALEADEAAMGPALELDIDVSALRGQKKGAPAAPAAKPPAQAQATPKPAAPAAKPAAPAMDMSAAMVGKEIGDGFGEPEEGPALELEQVDRAKAERVVVKGQSPEAKAELAKEEQLAVELADYGDEPETIGESVKYAIHVVRRLMALKRDRVKVDQDAKGLEADYNTALVEMGQALMTMGSDPKLTPVRSRVAAVHDANAKVTSADQTMSKTKEANLLAVQQLERQANEMRAGLAPFVAAEQSADHAHKLAEEEVKRAQAHVKRVEIELRALSEAKAPGDAAKLDEVRAQLEQRKLAVQDQQGLAERAAQALGQTRRDLAMKRGALDALEEKKKQLIEEAREKEAAVEERAKEAEGTQAAALRALAMAAMEQKLQDLVEDRYVWVKEVEGALAEAKKVVKRYDRALVLYDRSAVIKGFSVVGGLVLFFLVGLLVIAMS